MLSYIEDMTVKQLKAELNTRCVRFKSNARKAELQELLYASTCHALGQTPEQAPEPTETVTDMPEQQPSVTADTVTNIVASSPVTLPIIICQLVYFTALLGIQRYRERVQPQVMPFIREQAIPFTIWAVTWMYAITRVAAREVTYTIWELAREWYRWGKWCGVYALESRQVDMVGILRRF